MKMSEKESKDDIVTVRVGRKSIRCKKSLLSANSEYFSAMFSSQMSECFTNIVKLKEVDADALKLLVRYCETETLNLKADNVLQVTEAASMLQFKAIVKSCVQYIIEHLLNNSSCLMLMSFAELHSIDELYSVAMQLSLWYIKDIIKSEDFLCLNPDQLHTFLNKGELNNVDQNEMVNAIKVWVKHDVPERFEHLHNLLKCLNCEYLYDEQLDCLSEEEVNTALESSSSKMFHCLDNRKNSAKRFCITETVWILPWKRGDSELAVFNQSGSELGTSKTQVLELDCKWSQSPVGCDDIHHITTAPWEGRRTGPAGYRACCIDCCVYVFGGELGVGTNRWLQAVWQFHVFKQQWNIVSELPVVRRHHSLASDGNDVYIMGGFGKHRILLSDAYRYNVATDDWSRLPDLPQAEYCGAAVVHRERLYVIKHQLMFMDLNEPLQWTVLTIPLPFEVGLFNAVSFNDKIYMSALYSTNVYEWDPVTYRTSVKGHFYHACGWTCVVKHHENREGNGPPLIRYKLVAVGNENLEAFDLETGEFSRISKLNHNVNSDHCVVAVPHLPEFKITPSML